MHEHRHAMKRDGPPKAVIFDLDGTLIDSTVDFQEFRRRLLAYIKDKGVDMSRYGMHETTVSMISRFEEEMLGKGVPRSTVDGYLDDIDEFLDEIEMMMVGETKKIEGAEETLMALRSRGVRIGILTRGCKLYAESALRTAGLDGHVDEMLARDRKSGIPPKPSPEAALELARRLGVPKEDAVMIGDYSIDYVCSRDAGIEFYGFASDEDSERSLASSGCSEMVRSLREFLAKIGFE